MKNDSQKEDTQNKDIKYSFRTSKVDKILQSLRTVLLLIALIMLFFNIDGLDVVIPILVILTIFIAVKDYNKKSDRAPQEFEIERMLEMEPVQMRSDDVMKSVQVKNDATEQELFTYEERRREERRALIERFSSGKSGFIELFTCSFADKEHYVDHSGTVYLDRECGILLEHSITNTDPFSFHMGSVSSSYNRLTYDEMHEMAKRTKQYNENIGKEALLKLDETNWKEWIREFVDKEDVNNKNTTTGIYDDFSIWT